jgi:HoxN/HupN/NixA family high-affinity nickel-transporter
MYRFFRRWMNAFTKTWHMFFVGVVFGIGFDTATEVLLLAATAATATQGLPWYAVLALPLLFAGGMTLFDTVDGMFMNIAYGWAFARPARKVYYNPGRHRTVDLRRLRHRHHRAVPGAFPRVASRRRFLGLHAEFRRQ